MNMFEKATKMKLRFASMRGDLTVEDLWDMQLTNKSSKFDLDTVAKQVNSQLKAEAEESFVAVSTNTRQKTLELQLEILKYIIQVKMDAAKEATERAQKAARRNQLMEILEQKQTTELQSMSKEDILKELASLE